jgi:hypothetical protein
MVPALFGIASPNLLIVPFVDKKFSEAGELLVRCMDSVLSIGAVTPSGKKRMSGGDFARGARFDGSERFA